MTSAKTTDSYTISIPEDQRIDLSQDKECCIITDTKNNTCHTIEFHEYGKLYSIPGLYEHLFYNHLRCDSPNQVAETLKYALNQSSCDIADLRVFDFGAGNGIMGETLNDAQKEQVITELHNRWSDPNSEIVKRMSSFSEKSPEILKPIIEL